MPRILLVAKYTFFVAIALGAGFAIERLTEIQRLRIYDAVVAQDLKYNASSSLALGNFNSVLDKHYLRCLTQPSKPFCLLSADKRLQLFGTEFQESPDVEVIESRLQNITSYFKRNRRRIHSLLVDFTKLMESLQVKILLIEPSILFCMLSQSKKYNLLTRGFNPGRFKGSRNIVTFGIYEKVSKKLNEINATNEILSAGFKIMKIRKWTKSWQWVEDNSDEFFETVHYFFIREEIAVHLVVFYTRETYLWHASLNSKDMDFEGLLFLNEEAFENITLLPLNVEGTSISRIFVPHDIRYFLKEIESSRFVECKANSSINMKEEKHPTLTVKQLNFRTMIAVKELKTLLAPEMISFWLWGKTLLGWYEQCDIWYHSTVLELGLTFKSIERLNLTDLFSNNEFLKDMNDTGVDTNFELHLNCYGLKVNIFIMHEENDVLWYRRTDEQNVQKLTYPIFPVCSTDVFGQKVNVPCNFDYIKSEIRQNWTDLMSTSSELQQEQVYFSDESEN